MLTLQTIPAREEEEYGRDQPGRIARILGACWGGGEYAGAREAGTNLPVYLPFRISPEAPEAPGAAGSGD